MKAGLTVGGIEVAISAPAGPLEAVLAERYSPFLGAVVAPVCELRIEPSGETAGQPNPPMAEVGGGAGDHITIDHIDFEAVLDLGGHGKLVTAADPYVIDHFFRLLYGLLVHRHDAVMLHSCGIITGGHAHVFAGQSGAGKSTLASLADDRPLLSDEHVIVRRMSDRWVAASTPFWGSYAKPGPARQAPLDTLWSLRQWPTNEVRRLEGLAAIRVALENAVLPSPDPDLKRDVFDVAVDLVAEVPVAELRFTPTTTVWEHIDERSVA
jgi:hypothetical protein